MKLKQAEKFLDMGEEKKEEKSHYINVNIPLKVEKDFIELGTKSAALINNVGRGNKYTLEFLKATLEELLPMLHEDMIGELIKSIKIIRTKKEEKRKKRKLNQKKKIKLHQKLINLRKEKDYINNMEMEIHKLPLMKMTIMMMEILCNFLNIINFDFIL